MKRIVKSPAHKIGAVRKAAIRKAVPKVAEERLAGSGKITRSSKVQPKELEGILMTKKECTTTMKRVVKDPPFKVSAAEKRAIRKAILKVMAPREANTTAAQSK